MRVSRHTGWLLILAAWLVAFACRPFVLGFYADDWRWLLLPPGGQDAWSWSGLAAYLGPYACRPVLGIISYLWASLCGESPFLWHCCAALFAAGAALALRAFLGALLTDRETADRGSRSDSPRWPIDVAVSLWLLFPWLTGATAFVSLAPALLSMIAFALAGASLLRAWRRGRSGALPASLLFLISGLTYEAFYGQFVVLILLGLCALREGVPRRRLAWATLGLTTAQLLGAAWNRLAPQLSATAHAKKYAGDWPGVFFANLRSLPDVLRYAASEFSPWLELAVLGMLALWLAALVVTLRTEADRPRGVRVCLSLGACVLGIVLSAAVLSLAGYRWAGRGLDSRTTLALSFWLATAFAVAWTGVTWRPRIFRIAAVVAPAILILLLAPATWLRVQDWRTAWQLEQEILATVPTPDLSSTPANALLLFVGPRTVGGVVVFDSYYDLDSALHRRRPELAHLRALPAPRERTTTWDGKGITQKNRQGEVIYTTTAERVWLWECGTSSAREITSPLTLHAVVAAAVGVPPQTAERSQ